MSNRVDFFQSEQTKLTLPAASVSIMIDGQLCPSLEVAEVVHSDWPEFSWAKLIYNPALFKQTELIASEEIGTQFAMGKPVCIQRIYNAIYPGSSAYHFPIFEGHIEEIETTITGDDEKVEITVKDFSAKLKRITIYGQWIDGSDCPSLFLAGVDTIFNDNGKANAAIEPIVSNGNTLTLFSHNTLQAKLWSYAEVINYLLCKYLSNSQLQKPSIEQLLAITGGQIVYDLDVTGLNLLEALHHCCERVGLKFKFVPQFVQNSYSQAIVFFRTGASRTVELNYQSYGEQFSVSKTNISKLHSRKSLWPITHKYIGQGDFNVYEATFELVSAWDSNNESTNYDEFSPSTNSEFYKKKDVYRKWCLNEAGDYSDEPYNRGEAFDFSKIFQSNNFILRRRRFWPALTTDKHGISLGYFLEVSFDGGLNWWQYLYAFNNLLDECGIWLSSDQLDANTWIAALKGMLKFRITASVISDERLNTVVADGPINSTIPVIENIITLPRQFKYRKVSSQSIFANACDDTLGTPDEIDDSTALYEFIRQTAFNSSETIETIRIQTPTVEFDYKVGDRVISSPDSRDMFSYRNDNRSIRWIKKVRMDFDKQCTDLEIVRQRSQWL